jgi:hypothetical protein
LRSCHDLLYCTDEDIGVHALRKVE